MCERACDASSTELILIGSDVLKPVSTSTCCFISLADAGKQRRGHLQKRVKSSFCRSTYQIRHLVDIKSSRSQFIGEYFFDTSVRSLPSLLSVKVTLNTVGIAVLFGVTWANEDAFSKGVDIEVGGKD